MSQDTSSAVVKTAPRQRVYKGCSKISAYDISRKLGEGTFGEVYQAHRRSSGEVVALKKILMHNEKDGFPITALREIKLLKLLDHVNIIKLEEMAIERNNDLKKRAIMYMVTPYMEHDLSGLLDNPDVKITEPQIKCYMQQLFRGLEYLHNSSILHRDMKAANLLISNRGVLKIADFGLARHYEGRPPQPGNGGSEAIRDYTSLVVTRWYRPPELLLQLRRYTTAIDMWGAGCVFGEMLKRKPILTGQSDLHQAQIIFELVGNPTEESMPGWSNLPGAEPVKEMQPSRGNIDQVFSNLGKEGLSLLKDLLKLDWRKRINATDALHHPYFRTAPLPAKPEEIPKFKDSHELDRRSHRPAKQNLPPAPQGGAVGGGANGDWGAEEVRASNGRWNDRGSGPSRGHHNRVPQGPHNRDREGRDHRPSRVPPGAQERLPNRRPAWQSENRNNGDQNGHARSSLPAPPADGRHALPHPPPPLRDTYVPDYTGGSSRGRNERREDRKDSRFVSERHSSERSLERTPHHRQDDRHWRERRPRDDYRDRDRDRPGETDRYRDRDRERDRDRADRGRRPASRSRSPEHRDRERGRER